MCLNKPPGECGGDTSLKDQEEGDLKNHRHADVWTTERGSFTSSVGETQHINKVLCSIKHS